MATLLLPAIQHPMALHGTPCPHRPTSVNVPAKRNVSHLLRFSWLTGGEFAGVCVFGLQADYFKWRQNVSFLLLTPICTLYLSLLSTNIC